MAALTIAVGVSLCVVSHALPVRAEGKDAKEKLAEGKVSLTLVISGLKQGDAEVEIRPGNGLCKFKPQTRKLNSRGESYIKVEVPDLAIQTANANRECSLSITVRESGEGTRFTRRGFRLAADAHTQTQAMTYYLNATALAMKVEDTGRKVK
jgi:hypothetical protein